ncbi:midcut-by-XrtH protein [Acidovorax sp. 62]|uniref:midcut-by-XrtH protein n=1 Tax=Acidovorax sp. 62 TaxID=2035203 RepID=UPI000C1A176C|nr:midcut-by-XrtH protein [Acidovorax sp. 62]
MKQWMVWMRQGVLAAAAGVIAQSASAQSMGTVAYSPLASQSVPTLSEWALIAMAAVLTACAYRTMKRQGHAALKVLAAGLLACAAFVGAQWSAPALAVMGPAEVVLDQAAGGIGHLPHKTALFFGDRFYVYTVQNTTSQPQRITALTPATGGQFKVPTGYSPQCTVGLILQANEVCYLRLYNASMPS